MENTDNVDDEGLATAGSKTPLRNDIEQSLISDKAHPFASKPFGYDDFCDLNKTVSALVEDLKQYHQAMVGGNFDEWVKDLDRGDQAYLSKYTELRISNSVRSPENFAKYFLDTLQAAGLLYAELAKTGFSGQQPDAGSLIIHLSMHVGRLQARKYCLSLYGVEEEKARREHELFGIAKAFRAEFIHGIFQFIEENYSGRKMSRDALGKALAGDGKFLKVLEYWKKQAKVRSIKPAPAFPKIRSMPRWLSENKDDPFWKDVVSKKVIG